MGNAIDRLRKDLIASVDATLSQRHPLGNPTRVAEAYKVVEKLLNGGVSGNPSIDRKLRAVNAFLASGRLENPQQAYLVAWSLCGTGDASKPILEREAPFKAFVSCVTSLTEEGGLSVPAWRGLLFSFFRYEPGARNDATGARSWLALREFLKQTFERFYRARTVRPAWMELLHENCNLLEDDPCASYAKEVLAGRTERIDRLCSELQIPQESWFFRELLLSQVKRVVGYADTDFKHHIPKLSPFLTTYRLYASPGLAALLDRFYRCADSSEDTTLRDLALELWSSPKLKANDSNWSAVSEDVKGMVLKWFLGRDIREFFEIFAADGTADSRRLDFWMRYLDEMKDAYFVLGNSAYHSRKPDHVQVRERNEGRVARLESGGSPDNNAFVMLFGQQVVVEFGAKGNACFVYERSSLPFELASSWFYGDYRGLKSDKARLRMIHKADSWEGEFEHQLRSLGVSPRGPKPRVRARIGYSSQPIRRVTPPTQTIRTNPTAQPSSEHEQSSDTFILLWAHHCGYKVDDRRPKGGTLKIFADDSDEDENERLRKWGFTYSANQSHWWRKD